MCLFCANIKMSRINFFALLNFPEMQDYEIMMFPTYKEIRISITENFFLEDINPLRGATHIPVLDFGLCLPSV